MNKILISDDKKKSIFKCLLNNVEKKKLDKNLNYLNKTLDDYLSYHGFEHGEKLFILDDDIFNFNDVENDTISKLIKELNINSESDNNIERLLNSVLCNHTDNESVLLVFFLNEKAGVDYFNLITTIVDSIDKDTSLVSTLILAQSVNPHFKKMISSANYNNTYHIILYSDDYFINIRNHSYSPHPPVIFRNDIPEGIKKEELPKIIITDPYAKYYRLRNNDVIQIERESGVDNTLLEKQLIYRHVTMLGNIHTDDINSDYYNTNLL